MERYCRHIVTERWRRPLEPLPGAPERPVASYDTLRDAVADADRRNARAEQEGYAPDLSYQVWDIEHLHLGDMLAASDCAETVARFRREAA